jgi:ABC-2 type transport system permease protein
LLEAAITNYGRAVASPQPLLNLMAAVVNRPAATNAGVKLAQVYTSLALLLSLVGGTTFVPQLLIEEKEKRTLRMLMVSPASFVDILIGKLLVVLIYQLILCGVVLVISWAPLPARWPL